MSSINQPFKRFRRNRYHPFLRQLLTQTSISTNDFIYPLFTIKGEGIRNEIKNMPQVYQMSPDVILAECELLHTLGLQAIILFGIPHFKDYQGSEAFQSDSIVANTIRLIKTNFPDMLIISDLCCCEYTDHGHCGILDKNGIVDNDTTLQLLNKQAIIHLQAGVDMLAPSGMMDGVVQSLRQFMDKQGYSHIPIMSYSTKFASSFYEPFREVAQCSPQFGNRHSYQMNIANSNEAILESLTDVNEQCDIVMVKPSLAYLDIVYQIKQATKMPICVYNVSGEYAMLQVAKQHHIIDYDKVLLETMTSFKRAGADIIISYHAKEIATLLQR